LLNLDSKGGPQVKKLLILVSILAVSGLLIHPASAHRDTSFTYDSTAGMFEDTYDQFKYSPAYLPSFQKSTLWSQFSNLETGTDYLTKDTANPSPYYLLGGQTDFMGMGRAGLMFDWNGAVTPASVVDYNGYVNPGFQESTRVTITDLNMDGQYDHRTESYAHIKKQDQFFTDDLYLAFGLGGGKGLDLGAAIRGVWDIHSPTYDLYTGGTPSLDDVARVRRYSMPDPATTVLDSAFDRSCTGSLNFSTSMWGLMLSGRLNDLMPNLDTIINVGPILTMNGNKLTRELSELTDDAPTVPGSSDYLVDHKVTGMEIGATSSFSGLPVFPGSGIGVFADVRGDLTFSPNMILTGIVGGSLAPMTYSGDAKAEKIDHYLTHTPNGGLTLTNDNTTDDVVTYTGHQTLSNLFLKLRAQYLAKGWKFGFGANFSFQDNYYETKAADVTNTTNIRSGTGVLGNDYTHTENSGNETMSKTENIYNTVELPLGLVINILDTLPIRFGAKHTITVQSLNKSTEITAQSPFTWNRARNDGTTLSGVYDINSLTESQNSAYSVVHTTAFYYGVSWWPVPDIQIDMTGFGQPGGTESASILSLWTYNLSFNFYF
jgi:hypothetical protein